MRVYWLSAEYAEEYIKNVERSTTRKVYDVVNQVPGCEEAEIQLYYVSEFKELLKNIGFRDIRFNPLIVLTTLIPKDLVKNILAE